MTATNLTLVLLAALLHAVWNLAAKNARGDARVFVWLYFTGSALLCLPFGIVQLAALDRPLGWEFVLAPTLSALLHIAYSMLLQTGYRHADLGVVYPVARGVGPLLSVTFAVVVLGEHPGHMALFGGLLIVTGILVVTGKQLFQRSSGLGAGLFYGVATGVAIAGYTLWDYFSVARLEIPPVVYFGAGTMAQSLLLLPWAVRRRGLIRPTWSSDRREILTVAVLSPLAYVLVLFAMQTTSVALVAPVRESSIVIGALMAWWLFREPDPLRRILGATVVLAGIALVAVS